MSNHCRISSGTFTDFSLRCTRNLQMLALTAFPDTVIWLLPSRPFLACQSAVFIAGILCQTEAHPNLMGNNNLMTMAPHPGKYAPRPMAVAVSSLISADQWEADTHVLFGVGWECMVIYVRDNSDIVGTRHVRLGGNL